MINTFSVSITLVLFILMVIGWWTERVTLTYSLIGVFLGLALGSTNLGQAMLHGVNTLIAAINTAGNSIG